MDDEIWTTRDGRKIPVGEMTESHVRNALRMVLRNARRHRERTATRMIVKLEDLPMPDEQFFERPDNPTQLAELRRRHGDAVRVEHDSMADMSGGNVYVGDEWVGWFGGI